MISRPRRRRRHRRRTGRGGGCGLGRYLDPRKTRLSRHRHRITGNNISLFSGKDATISANIIGTGVFRHPRRTRRAGRAGIYRAGPALNLQGSTISLAAGNSAIPGSTVRFARSVNLTSTLKSTSIAAGAGLIDIQGGVTVAQTNDATLTMTADDVNLGRIAQLGRRWPPAFRDGYELTEHLARRQRPGAHSFGGRTGEYRAGVHNPST